MRIHGVSVLLSPCGTAVMRKTDTARKGNGMGVYNVDTSERHWRAAFKIQDSKLANITRA